MNFFEHQDQARKRTGQLVFLFCMAVIALIVATTLLVAAFLGFTQAEQGQSAIAFLEQLNWHNTALVSLGVIVVVGGGTLYKLAQLSAGGKVVAQMMGGTLVTSNNVESARERQLLNIVEEMAIASGTPVPPVYIMRDEQGINAFAAGFKNSDAVIGITRGCIDALDRDELQGVIAHEFSHILHGDMRINIRIMGILHGILLIGLIGYQLLDKMWWAGRRRDNNGAMGIVALAIGLIVVGFGGIFFGNLIKAAVSRQREYLADASAVQFTRNPEGIANALKKIGGYQHGTLMHNPNTEEASHMLFGAGTRRLVGGLFATHPPLDKRIRSIEPRWDGKFLAPNTDNTQTRTKSTPPPSGTDKLKSAMGAAMLAEQAINTIGNPQAEHLDYAQQTLRGLPEDWHTAAQQAASARAVIYALLLDDDAEIRQHQCQHIRNLDGDMLASTQLLYPNRPQLEDKDRLSLVDIALPQLGQMDTERFTAFDELLDALIRADQRISLFEWSLYAILMHHLKAQQGRVKPPQAKHRELSSVAGPCQVLFSILAIAGNASGQRQAAFDAAKTKAGLPQLQLLPAKQLGITPMSEALESLNTLYPLAKPKLLKACIACICADDKVTATEAELVRAIGDSLDCPIPPFSVTP